ncbi:hypothetical protein EJ02DRAFT_269821 [Clathrospora elynae]|uniref:Uncharacterized protein n=1 Tax=Clathrospora elynae TaxID=706981 RepID=A0A6A5SJZ9_9PLEO|nr:hypothetical protein EJ02DRAFT_269821 [Clathrospora elynae]
MKVAGVGFGEEDLSKRESDKVVVDVGNAAHKDHTYQTGYPDLPGVYRLQELEPLHLHMVITDAREMKGNARPGQLPHDQMEDISPAHRYEDVPTLEATHTTNAMMSPHVEAQRKREVEWLDMEEKRFRQRR